MKGESDNANPGMVESIFHAALGFSGGERTAYLAGACGDDVQLRQRVEALLRAHEAAQGFLPEQPTEASTVAMVTETPGTVIGRYKLLEKIAEGGFGAVYVAEQKEPVRRRVALKIIKLGMDTRQVVARFEVERQALALMDHPNIAKVLDAGATETGRPYFVMELVRGIKITEYCDQNNLGTRERLDLFMQVCRAIQHAHQKGIIHRDIKPSNILVTLHDGVPVPKVIDFGIAKATQGELSDKTVYTQFQQFIGTPAYMSPEQAEMSGLDIDTRSDIYSLGVLLYELLTGKTPFDAKELLEAGLDTMRRTIREKEPVRPSTRVGALTGEELTTTAKRRGLDAPKLINLLRGDLDWIVMKALEKDRTRRYETAIGLGADIQRHLSNEPVLARPRSNLYRFQKMVRRNKVAFGAATAVAVALFLGMSISTWLFLKEREAEREQSRLREAAVKAQANEAKQRQRAEEARNHETQLRQKAELEAYASHMNLAQLAWEQNNVERVLQLLAETAAYSACGFEWYYWQRQTHVGLKTLRGHRGVVAALAISPEGQRIVTGSEDQTAKLWDAASGKELFTLRGHSSQISSVAFSPDGQRIVTGSDDRTAKIWDAATARELLTLRGHRNGISSVAFSSNGRQIVTGCWDKTAKVWETASGKELLTLRGHTSGIRSAAFSPDSQRIVTTGSASYDAPARIWDATSGDELLALRESFLAFSSDGRLIVTATQNQTANVRDIANGKELLVLKGHSEDIGSAAFSPDGLRIITGSLDETAKVWEAASGKELFTLKGHNDHIRSVGFSLDGQRILTIGKDRTVRVWDTASGKELLTTKANAWLWSSSPDGRRLVTSGSGDQTAQVWDAAGTKELLTFQSGDFPLFAVAFSPDRQRIVTGSWSHAPGIREASNGKELLTLKGHGGRINSVAFSPDGQRIVSGSDDQTVRVWEAASGKPLLTLKGHNGAIASVAFSRDGQRIVTGSRHPDLTAKVWDAAKGKELLTLKGHSHAISSVAFSPDGKRIVTGCWDKTAKVWDLTNGRELLTLTGHRLGILSAAFSPDGGRIVTGSWDKTAKVWDSANGMELVTLDGHSDTVLCVAFSPDGSRVVTGSYDKTAKVWEASSGKELLTLKMYAARELPGFKTWSSVTGWNAAIISVFFSPDGKQIVTASEDSTAQVWEAASVEEVVAWQKEEGTDAGRKMP